MRQSRTTSLVKSVISTAAGFGIAILTQIIVFPLFGFSPPLSTNFLITCIFTVVSLLRGFVLERLFEYFGMRVRLSPFMEAAIAERQRQIAVEGWSTSHDDDHRRGELAQAGAAYALCAGDQRATHNVPEIWPWSADWWKPAGFRRDLVKACALIIAEGEKFDRGRKPRPDQRRMAS